MKHDRRREDKPVSADLMHESDGGPDSDVSQTPFKPSEEECFLEVEWGANYEAGKETYMILVQVLTLKY